MKIIETTIYKCEFCNKIYQLKPWAIKHELGCSKNPDNNRPCFHCDYFEKIPFELGEDHPECGEYMVRLNLLHCSKRNVFLYPPQVEFKKNAYDLEDECNEPMPKSCEYKND